MPDPITRFCIQRAWVEVGEAGDGVKAEEPVVDQPLSRASDLAGVCMYGRWCVAIDKMFSRGMY
jgi:hypothetical protein